MPPPAPGRGPSSALTPATSASVSAVAAVSESNGETDSVRATSTLSANVATGDSQRSVTRTTGPPLGDVPGHGESGLEYRRKSYTTSTSRLPAWASAPSSSAEP